MLQRIQSVFLLVAFLAVILLFFFPMASIYQDISTSVYYKFYVYGINNTNQNEPSIFSFMTTIPLLLINCLAGVLSLAAIFLYKNRVTQMKLVRLAILLEIVLVALIFFVYARIVEKNLQITPDYLDEAGIYFPLVTLVFLILANRSILKDEKLVRSVDRLR